MSSFKGKIALVTGGTQGMGLVTAAALARAGAAVVISGREDQKGQAAAAELAQHCTADVRYLRADIAQPASVERLVEQVLEMHGRLDVAFNNAGVTTPKAPLHEAQIDDWQRTIDINLNGTFYSLKYEIAAILQSGGGAIVNNSSIAGVTVIPNQAAYVASKAAIIGLTKAAAVEYAEAREERPQVRINVIAPGPILGGMNTPENLAGDPERTARKKAFAAMNRFGRPEEVAATVLWLLSDESAYLTGVVVPVDGGASIGKPL